MQITISPPLDEATMSQFGKICEAAGLSPSNMLRELIQDFISKNFSQTTRGETKPDKTAKTWNNSSGCHSTTATRSTACLSQPRKRTGRRLSRATK